VTSSRYGGDVNPAEVEALVAEFLTHWQSQEGSAEWSMTFGASGRLLDLRLEGPCEDLWRVIQAAYPRPMSDEAFAMLAAGPVEGLLCSAGAAFIDRVEQLAESNVRFNHLPGGVWKSGIDPAVWARIEKVRRTTW
jgi:hypothetical protein